MPLTDYILEMQRDGTYGDKLTFFNAEIILLSTLGLQALTATVRPNNSDLLIRIILGQYAAAIVIIL